MNMLGDNDFRGRKEINRSNRQDERGRLGVVGTRRGAYLAWCSGDTVEHNFGLG
jgi:hypothetical protein